MKKYLFSLLAIIYSVCTFAYEGYGTCNVNGTSEYIEGTAYLNLSGSSISGNLVITNSCTRPLQSASINVTVDYSWKQKHTSPYDGGTVVNSFNKSVTLYNSRWTGNIAGLSSGNITLSGKLSLQSNAYAVEIESVNVSINNPYCK
ncbi:MAG: hypothetical protein K2L14_06795 [Duncaniella sp.]|nr:hypothetical protein [Duncaniella sp.]